jgi:hypothetical protein
MSWHTYRRRPRYQTVRYPNGHKTVIRRYSPGNWTRTTIHPDGRRAVTRSTTVGPLTKLFGIAIALTAPATLWGAFSIPIYVAAAIILVLWLRRRTALQSTLPKTVLATERRG